MATTNNTAVIDDVAEAPAEITADTILQFGSDFDAALRDLIAKGLALADAGGELMVKNGLDTKYHEGLIQQDIRFALLTRLSGTFLTDDRMRAEDRTTGYEVARKWAALVSV